MKFTWTLFSLLSCCCISSMARAVDKTTIPLDNNTLTFIENKGQIIDQYGHNRGDIDFRMAAGNLSVFIGSGQVHYQWAKPKTTIMDNALLLQQFKKGTLSLSYETYRMDVTLVGANPDAKAEVAGMQDYHERYYLAHTGENGVLAHSYSKILYRDIYPGIDWVIYTKDGNVEYDFEVHPGGNVADIKLQYGGATSMHINEDGSFTSATPMGTVTELAPYSYKDGGQAVASRFVLQNNMLSFATGDYSGTLTIDPTLKWGTYYGTGFLAASENTECDAKGNLYFVGYTTDPTNIATVGSYQSTAGGGQDAFLVKFTKDGVRLWSTFYGGAASETAYGLVADSLGNIYMSGETTSTMGIATPGSHQSSFSGGSYNDAYLVKFDTAGARLWATYYGGTALEAYAHVATDGENIYMSGFTSSTAGISTVGSHQEVAASTGSKGEVFLVKFNGAGVRQWATYYGGSEAEGITPDIGCDKKGYVYICGRTKSSNNIATPGSFQDTYAGGADVFLAKFNSAGVRQWATYYGGPAEEAHNEGASVSFDDSDNVYLVGNTASASGIATANSYQDVIGGKLDGFLVKFNSVGVRQWATYYGGAEDEDYLSIATGANHKLYMIGTTQSTAGIATSNAYQAAFAGGSTPWGDIFLAEMDAATGNRLWATYYGGQGNEAADIGSLTYNNGYVYFPGLTSSVSGIATAGSFQDTFLVSNGFSLFIPHLAAFCFAEIPAASVIQGNDSACANGSDVYTIAKVDDASTYIWTLPNGWTGSSDSNSIHVMSDNTGGTIEVRVVRCNDTSEAQRLDVHIRQVIPVTITVNGFVLGTASPYMSYQWYLDGNPIQGADQATYTASQNGVYSVKVTDANGCTDSGSYTVTNVLVGSVQGVNGAVGVYPNPVKNTLHIQAPVPFHAVINSIDGKTLVQQSGGKNIDVSALAEGMYILRVTDESGNLLHVEKIVKTVY